MNTGAAGRKFGIAVQRGYDLAGIRCDNAVCHASINIDADNGLRYGKADRVKAQRFRPGDNFIKRVPCLWIVGLGIAAGRDIDRHLLRLLVFLGDKLEPDPDGQGF